MNDRTVPWFVLVPRVSGIREIHQLAASERGALMEEISLASKALETVCRPDKINVASLGNVVPQLHVHVVARNATDRAWPGPVWGSPGAAPYGEAELKETASRLREAFGG